MIYLKLVLTMILWGGTFVAGRQIAGQIMIVGDGTRQHRQHVLLSDRIEYF